MPANVSAPAERVASQREVARRLGISHTAPQKAAQAGRIAQEPGGGWDVEKVRASLAALITAVEHRPFDAVRWNCGRLAMAAVVAGTGQRPSWRHRPTSVSAIVVLVVEVERVVCRFLFLHAFFAWRREYHRHITPPQSRRGGVAFAGMSDSAPKDPRLIAIIVASALFMQNLDSAAVITALPSMARDMGEEPARLGVAITSYLVALTVFIPFSGWVADRFGPKRIFMLAIALFATASAACGLSDGLGQLVAARIVQGLAGAMMVPVGRLLLLRGLRKDQMLTAMTWLTMPGMLGPISGPILGGVLTDLFGWRSVFWINIPVGVLGLCLVAWKIPRVAVADPGPPDTRGLLLVGSAMALFMFGLETAGRGVMPWGMPEAGLGLGVLVGLVAVRHCLRASRPALDFSLLRVPTFHAAAATGTIFRVGAGASPFLVPVLLQVGFGWSATEAGVVSFATALGALAMKPLARPILRRWGFRGATVWGSALAGASLAACALFTASWPLPAMFLVLAIGGLFRSLQFTSLNTLAFADLPQARFSAATGFYGIAQQISPALGVVLATTTLELSAAIAGRPVAAADFSVAFIVAGLLTASAAPFFARLPADAGDEVSGHRDR